MNDMTMQIVILVAFIALMYFLLIRPQKKKEKEVKEMRDSVSVGDEVVTIGGICGKIVKTKEDSLVIQVGADKTKFEIKRWAISTVTSKGKKSGGSSASVEDTDEEAPARRNSPRRLKKAAKPAEEVKEAVEEAAPEAEKAEEPAEE
jgi:preprotein translocase YajC subunit